MTSFESCRRLGIILRERVDCGLSPLRFNSRYPPRVVMTIVEML
jgi:hypothetical protein